MLIDSQMEFEVDLIFPTLFTMIKINKINKKNEYVSIMLKDSQTTLQFFFLCLYSR